MFNRAFVVRHNRELRIRESFGKVVGGGESNAVAREIEWGSGTEAGQICHSAAYVMHDPPVGSLTTCVYSQF